MVKQSALSLSVEHVSHSYELQGVHNPVLADISFDVKPGEFVALLGPSGSGKSTILRLIAGLEVPQNGVIRAGEQVITGPGPDRIVMFQDPTLYPWLTVEGNVGLGLEIQKQSDPGKVQHMLGLVGLQDYGSAWPHQLSGGMAQRAALARALVNDPQMLILDEPLGKLDSLTRLTMQTEIARFWRERGFTALMVTHDVEEALLLATRIIVFSPRPARIVMDVPVELPASRHRDDPVLMNMRRDILRQLGHGEDW